MRHLCSVMVLLLLAAVSTAHAAPGFEILIVRGGEPRGPVVTIEAGGDSITFDAGTETDPSPDLERVVRIVPRDPRRAVSPPDEVRPAKRIGAKLRFGRASLRGLVRNRFNDSEPLYECLSVLEIREKGGGVVALLLFLPLDESPEGLEAAVRAGLEPGCTVLLLPGPGADQVATGSAEAFAERVEAARKSGIPVDPENGIEVHHRQQALPPSAIDHRRTAPEQAIMVGNLGIQTVPGRMTADAGLELLARVRREIGNTDDFELLLVCRANADIGLVPTRRQWETGRYPAEIVPFGPYEAVFGIEAPPRSVPPAVEVEPLAGPTRKNRFSVQRVWLSSPQPSGYPANDRFPVEHYVPEGGARGAVIVLPIWRGGVLLAERVVATHLAKRGYEAAIMPLPWQFQRAPQGVGSGAWTVSSDLVRTKAAMEQALADVRALTDWLHARESVADGKVGVLGISLGAHVAAGAYQLDDRFRAGVFVMAGGDPASMIWAASKETRGIKRDLVARGVTLEKLREMLKPLDPAAALGPQPFPGFPRYRGALMINGTQDTVIPPANARVLHEALGRPEIVWFEVNHYSMAEKLEEILELTDRHLDRLFR